MCIKSVITGERLRRRRRRKSRKQILGFVNSINSSNVHLINHLIEIVKEISLLYTPPPTIEYTSNPRIHLQLEFALTDHFLRFFCYFVGVVGRGGNLSAIDNAISRNVKPSPTLTNHWRIFRLLDVGNYAENSGKHWKTIFISKFYDFSAGDSR